MNCRRIRIRVYIIAIANVIERRTLRMFGASTRFGEQLVRVNEVDRRDH